MKRTILNAAGMLIYFTGLNISTAQTNSVKLKNASQTILGTYNSIASAYAAIPSTLSQAYFIELTSSYNGGNETYPIVFTSKTGASAGNTITLRPDSSVTSVSISGTASGNPLINLNDADFIRIDGRPAGLGTTKALTVSNQGTSSTSYGIQFINGACNNIIRYIKVSGYTTSSTGGKGIYISSSSSNTSGNSDNRFEFITFNNGPRYYLNSSGTAANPNRNLTVYGCEFMNINFCGWWQQNGTGRVHVDSCQFFSNTSSGSSGTGCFAILSDFQTDTINITRNNIYNIDNSSYTTDVYGMCFRSFNAGSVLRISNNFISLMAPNTASDQVYGIELGTNSAANPVDCELYFNTIRIGGTATGGTTGNVNSTGFSLDASNTGSTIKGRNNIFINERTGGNEQHVSVVLFTFNGTILSDYNIMKSATTNFARLGTTVYNSFTSYQAVILPNDTNSNDTTVHFVSNTDLHLTGSSVGHPALIGTPIAGITLDFDGQLRTVPYRGADESAGITGCLGTPVSKGISNPLFPAEMCEGDSTEISVIWLVPDSIPYIYVQWQVASLSNFVFTDIPGANDDTLDIKAVNKDLYLYRYVLVCTSSGDSSISDTSYILVEASPQAGTISTIQNDKTFTFGSVGSQNALLYIWRFGDGSDDLTLDDTISHTYSDTGIFTVTLIVTNPCGTDSTTIEIHIMGPGGLDEFSLHKALVIFPNPASDYLDVAIEGREMIRGLAIYSLSGSLIAEFNNLNTGKYRLDTSSMPGGSYVLRVSTTAGVGQRIFQLVN